jgi:hypothetical protein
MKSRIEENYEQSSPFATLARGDAYAPVPQQRKQGLRPIRILVDEMDIDALIRMGLLKEDQRQDPKALQKAVLGLLYHEHEPASA